jgi:hypothetical protein
MVKGRVSRAETPGMETDAGLHGDSRRAERVFGVLFLVAVCLTLAVSALFATGAFDRPGERPPARVVPVATDYV